MNKDSAPQSYGAEIEALRSRVRELEMENARQRQIESELFEHEGSLRAFFNAIDYLIFVLDGRGNIIFANDTVIRKLGFSFDELNGQSVLMVHPLERHAEVERIVGEMLIGKADSCSVPLMTKDRRQMPVETRVFPGKWSGKDVIFGVTKDLSDIKASKEKLRLSEERYRHVSSTISDIAYSCVMDENGDYGIDWLSGAVEQIVGYTEEELKNIRCWGHLVLEEDFPIFEKEVAALVPGESGHAELRIRRKDGEIRWLSSNAECAAEQVNGAFRIYGALVDVTERRKTEEAFSEEQARYRRLVNGMPGIVYVFSDKRGGIYYSPHVEQVLGYSREHLYAHPFLWNSSIHPDDRSVLLKSAADFAAGKPFSIEYRVRDAHGQWRWLLDRSIGRRVENGEILVEGLATDITDQKQAEEKIRESEAQNRAIINSVPDLLFRMDRRGVILDFHAPEGSPLYVSPEFFLNKSVRDILPPQIAGLAMDAIERALTENRMAIFEYELEVNGELHYYEDRIAPLNADQVLSVIRDITERKRAEEELQTAETRYHALFEQSHDAVFLLDMQGRHILVNQRAADLLGYTPDELAQLSVRDTSAETEQSNIVMKKLLQGEHVPLYERMFRKKNGDLISVEISVEVVRDAKGQPMHVQSVVRDITERKRVDEELRNNELRYRIVADNTHDWEFWQAPDGQFLYVSPSCQRITGIPADELLRDPDLLLRIVHRDDIAAFLNHRQMVTAKRVSGDCEFRIILPDGGIRWISHVCQPVFDALNNYLGVRGSNRDDTSRKYMNIDLAGANEQLRLQVKEILQLQTELREQALHDPQTNLYNRRYLSETLERDLARMKREKKPLSVIMMDIDHFKIINDTYGHPMGDQFLAKIAEVILSHTRGSDIACRYGGEEFLLVMPGATPKSAIKRAEDIRLACAEIRIPHQKKSLKVTLSFGVAAYPTHGKNAEEIIANADAALYDSKHNGRNKVSLSSK